MKFNYKSLIFLLAICVSFAGCEEYLGGDLNEDPNNPTSVPVFAQMPAIQIAIADVYGGAFSRFNSMLIQQVEGVERQWESFNQYTGLTPNRFDAAWNNVYENILNEILIGKAASVEDGLGHYEGVLSIMEAFTLMAATDVWDNMPYSDALKGVGSINPSYDEQTAIYSVLYGLLDRGVSLLDGAPGPVAPGSEDVFYGGDADLWKKAAFALRARGAMKDKDYSKALSEARNSFASASENLAFQYPDANAAGQWFRFNRDRTGDIEFHPTMRAIMQGLNDTVRLSMMDETFITTHPYLVPDFLQELITYREMQFIIAEADFRQTGGSEEGHTAYLNGIKASFDRFGLDQAAYDAYVAQSDIDPGVGNLTLEHIMTQKYIAMFLQPEAYSDWRRTNIPALTPVSGTAVPVRWDYSSTEYLFNSNSPAEGSVSIYTDRVGWNR